MKQELTCSTLVSRKLYTSVNKRNFLHHIWNCIINLEEKLSKFVCLILNDGKCVTRLLLPFISNGAMVTHPFELLMHYSNSRYTYSR